MNEIIFVVEDSPEGGYVAKAAGEHDLVVPRQHGERAEVEDLVVEGTKREAVLHHVRLSR